MKVGNDETFERRGFRSGLGRATGEKRSASHRSPSHACQKASPIYGLLQGICHDDASGEYEATKE
jgi:hypothetical protein